jgi:hypothetical protein
MRVPKPAREALIQRLNGLDRSAPGQIAVRPEAVKRAEAVLETAYKGAQNVKAVV